MQQVKIACSGEAFSHRISPVTFSRTSVEALLMGERKRKCKPNSGEAPFAGARRISNAEPHRPSGRFPQESHSHREEVIQDPLDLQ